MDKHKRLYSLIEDRLARDPDSIAFIVNDTPVTVTDFDRLCRRLDPWLGEQRIEAGDVVAVWLVNRLEWLALFFTLARRGATLAAINTRYRREEVEDILKRSGARLLIMQSRFRNIDFAEVLSRIDGEALPALEKIVLIDDQAEAPPNTLIGKATESFAAALRSEPSSRADHSDPERCAILFTTSGTTKKPKLVMQAQYSHVGHAHDASRAYGLDQDGAVTLAALPFCGTFGLNSVLPALAGGAPVVVLEAFDAPLALALMERHRVTHTFGSDEMYRQLIDQAKNQRPFATARIFGFGAFTSSFDDYARAAWKKGVPLHGLYGSSEVLALFSCQPRYPDVDERIKGGGQPVAGERAHIRVRDVDNNQLLPAGKSGEVEILSPSNFMRYLNDADATAEAVTDDGYFRTGDLGYLRDDGSFVFEARMGDAIRLSGFLVNPAEIEAVLKTFDGVADAQVVAVDVDGQSRAVAFVIPIPGQQPDGADLIARSRDVMAPFKAPARVWLVDEYPVTQSSNGVKTQRNKLRAMALARLTEE